MNQTKQQKKQENYTLVVLGLVLAIVWLVSKFVIGINFSVMEQGGHISIGYHEIREDDIWVLAFESFTGSITADVSFPDNAKRRLQVYSRTQNASLELSVQCGDEKEVFILTGAPLDLTVPGDNRKFSMTLSGTEVMSGYFNAIWE